MTETFTPPNVQQFHCQWWIAFSRVNSTWSFTKWRTNSTYCWDISWQWYCNMHHNTVTCKIHSSRSTKSVDPDCVASLWKFTPNVLRYSFWFTITSHISLDSSHTLRATTHHKICWPLVGHFHILTKIRNHSLCSQPTHTLHKKASVLGSFTRCKESSAASCFLNCCDRSFWTSSWDRICLLFSSSSVLRFISAVIAVIVEEWS